MITGTGSGIGRALAQAFHSLGNKLIMTGRRKHKLDEVVTENPGMIAYELDMQDRVAVSDFAQMITAQHPMLNVVINKAGVMLQEDLTQGEPAVDQLNVIMETNFLGPVRLNAALV